MAEGSDSKDTSSPNEVVETFLEPNNDQVVPPSLPSPEYVPLSHTGSKVRVKPYSVPSSEQLALMRRVPEQIVIARQPASTNIDESERHSLDNTGSNNNSPDNSGNLKEIHRNSAAVVLSDVSSSLSADTANGNRQLVLQQQQQQASATGNCPPEGLGGVSVGNVVFPDNGHIVEELESTTPAQHTDLVPLICLECTNERRNTILIPCMELCVCRNCGENLRKNKGLCPSITCRRRVEGILDPSVNIPPC